MTQKYSSESTRKSKSEFTTKPHDAYFRKEPEKTVAHDFLQAHLPHGVLAVCNLSTLKARQRLGHQKVTV